MPDFTAKMQNIRFRLGSAQDPSRGAHSVPSDPLVEFREKGVVGKGLERGGDWEREEHGEGRG